MIVFEGKMMCPVSNQYGICHVFYKDNLSRILQRPTLSWLNKWWFYCVDDTNSNYDLISFKRSSREVYSPMIVFVSTATESMDGRYGLKNISR